MDQKKIKEGLKSARELIKNKQFAEAFDSCKEILASDARNYNALVFQGAALAGLRRFAEAVRSYRLATDADPAQLLAWQGICSVYEKQQCDLGSAEKAELIDCYEKLFSSVSAEKSLEIGLKLCEACLSQSLYDRAVATCLKLMSLDSWRSAEEKIRFSVWKTLSIALPLSSTTPDGDLLERSCRAVVDSALSDAKDKTHCWEHLIRCSIKKLKNVDEVWRMCMESCDLLEEPVFQLELMCQMYLDTYLVRAEPYDPSVTVEKLRLLRPGSGWLKQVEGHQRFLGGDFSGAESQLSEGLKVVTVSVVGNLYEGLSLIGVRRFREAASVFKKGLALLNGETLFFGSQEKTEEVLRFSLAKALLEDSVRDRWNEAMELCQQLCQSDAANMDYKLCLARVLLKLEAFERVKEIMDEIALLPVSDELLVLHGTYLFSQGKYDEAALRFQEAVEVKADCTSAHFHLGLISLHQLETDGLTDEEKEELRTKCLKYMLQAAKLDPSYPDVFVCLGHFYHRILSDLGKARRCYQKAFELDGDNQEAGAGLVDCLLALNEQESALKILQTITDSSKADSPKWAWVRLGLHQMKFEDPTDAIRSFQTAVKRDPKDPHCWECLGDAFVNRGSYSSAVKVFTKVTELSPDDLYSYFQIAALKLKMGLYVEAVDQYGWILEKSPDYLPALQGLSEAYLQQARQELNRLLYGRAADHCQEAMSYLTRAAKMRPEMSCLWKQLGDACTILHVVPSQKLRISVPCELLGDSSSGSEISQSVSQKELLALGARCYGMALKLRPEMSSLWHDLGVNYFCQAKAVEKVMSKGMALKSLQALRKAVTVNPTNHQHWTALGVIAASKELSDPGLAQHCFIQSIEVEPNNVVAWTNLGTLYLINNHVKLAHEAFKVAQSLEPSYTNSWIGQAFIAESMADHEAMDLFRHTTELCDNLESCIGYGHWVCLTLKDSEKMSMKWYQYAIDRLNAVTAASDALSKYTDCVADNLVAWNLFGILLERQNLIQPAFSALERAMQLLATSGVDGNSAASLAVRENYARLLCKTGKYNEAIEVYQDLTPEKPFDVLCGLSLSLLKAGQVDKSIQMYEKALDLSSDPRSRSLVRTALGMASFTAKDVNSAKTHFFQSVKDSPSSMEGLKALLSLAFLQRDPDLLLAVFQTTQKTVPANVRPLDLVVLTTYVQLIQRNTKAAMLELVRNIHLHPHLAESWTQLAKFIMMTQPDGHNVAEHCSKVALSGDTNHCLEAQLCLGLASLPRLTSVNHEAFRAAQKAVHLQPDSLSSWSLLLGACHLESIARILMEAPRAELMAFTMATAERIFLQIESELKRGQMHKPTLQLLRKWCSRQYALSLLITNRLETATKFLEQAAWYYDDDPVICGLNAYFIKGNALKDMVKEKPSISLFQILLSWLLSHGSVIEAHNCYKTWHQETKSSSLSSLALAVQSSVAALLFQIHKEKGNEKELKDLLEVAKKCKDEELLKMFREQKTS